MQGQNFGFKQLSTEQGLSQNSVSRLLLDERGYLWIGTQDGLNRFDGKQCKVYTHQSPPHRIHNIAIKDMIMGPNQELYILGNYGVERFYTDRDSSELIYPLPSIQPYETLLYDEVNQELLINRLDHLGFRPLSISETPQPTKEYTLLANNLAQDALISYRSSNSSFSVRSIRGQALFQFYNRADSSIQDIFELIDQEHLLCSVVTARDTLLALAQIGASGYVFQKSQVINDIIKVFRDPLGQRICAITSQGNLVLMDEQLQLIKKINAYQSASSTAPPLYLTDGLIHQDHLWLGVDPFGVFYRSLGDNQFSTRLLPQEPPAIIKNLFTDTQNRLYAFVLNQGIEVFDPNGQLITSEMGLPTALRNPNIFAGFNGLKALGANQFVLTGKAIFGRFDARESAWVDYYDAFKKQVPEEEFSDLYLFYETMDQNRAYVSTNQMLYQFDLNSQKARFLHRFPHPITHLMRDSHQVWVGTTSGLYAYTPEEIKVDSLFKGLIIKDIRRDSSYGLMISSSGGLYLSKDSLKIINQQSGLKNSYVYGALRDHQGLIWVSTNQGLSRINPSNWRIRNYDRTDGLAATEFNSYGFWKDQNGSLYFSGMGGITLVNPLAEQNIQESIPLTISALSINDRLPQALYPKDSLINLAPDQNTLTFHFQDLYLPIQGPLAVRYQLDGFDRNWVDSDQSSVRYPQL
ncbi:MAG: two-component regulator propeller domain-containing protein, partial [Bacteroidota bacterium]